MTPVYIRENYRRIDCHNPISGHRWTEHGPTNSYTVVGPTGPLSTHSTEAKAEKAKVGWQAFYDKYPPTALKQ